MTVISSCLEGWLLHCLSEKHVEKLLLVVQLHQAPDSPCGQGGL